LIFVIESVTELPLLLLVETSARLLSSTTADGKVTPLLKQHTRSMSLASHDHSSDAGQAGAFSWLVSEAARKFACWCLPLANFFVYATGLFPVMAINLLLLTRQPQGHSGLVSRAQSLQLLPVIIVFVSALLLALGLSSLTDARTSLDSLPLQPHRNLAASSEAGLTIGVPDSASFSGALPIMVKSLNLNKHCSMHLASIMTSTSRSLPCRFMGP